MGLCVEPVDFRKQYGAGDAGAGRGSDRSAPNVAPYLEFRSALRSGRGRGRGQPFTGDGKLFLHGDIYDVETEQSLTELVRQKVRLDIIESIEPETYVTFEGPDSRPDPIRSVCGTPGAV